MAGGLSPLNGTLQGLDALTLADAAARQQAAELAARTASTTQAASQAGQAYQTAAAAPPAELDPFQQLIPALFGNVASVLSQNPVYQQQGQQQVEQSRASLLKARADNLAGLKDIYAQKAEAAQRAGDLETTEKARLKLEQVSKTYDLVAANAKHAADVELEGKKQEGDLAVQRLKNEGELAAARVRASTAETPDVSGITFTTAKGQQFVDLGGLTGKAKNAAIKAATDAGLLALTPQDASAVKDVDRARRDMVSMSSYLEKLLPADPAERAANWANYAQQKWLQTDADRAAFKTWRDTAIPTLRGLAGARGLRISMQQIQVMIDNLPKENDTIDTAARKFAIINTLLDNAEAPLITRNWQTGPGTHRQAPPASGGTVIVVSPDGKKRREIPAEDVPEAVRHGWGRSH